MIKRSGMELPSRKAVALSSYTNRLVMMSQVWGESLSIVVMKVLTGQLFVLMRHLATTDARTS